MDQGEDLTVINKDRKGLGHLFWAAIFILSSSICCFAFSSKAVFTNNRGVDYDNNGDQDSAIEAYKKAIELDDQYPDPYYNLGTLYYEQGKYELAVQFLQQAVKLKRNYSEAHSELGMAFMKLNFQEKAKEEFETAVSQKTTQFAPYYGLAQIAFKKQDYQTAKTLVDK